MCCHCWQQLPAGHCHCIGSATLLPVPCAPPLSLCLVPCPMPHPLPTPVARPSLALFLSPTRLSPLLVPHPPFAAWPMGSLQPPTPYPHQCMPSAGPFHPRRLHHAPRWLVTWRASSPCLALCLPGGLAQPRARCRGSVTEPYRYFTRVNASALVYKCRLLLRLCFMAGHIHCKEHRLCRSWRGLIAGHPLYCLKDPGDASKAPGS